MIEEAPRDMFLWLDRRLSYGHLRNSL